MAQSYKALKEGFVSNLSGGSVTEINYVTAVAPVDESLRYGFSLKLTLLSRQPTSYGQPFRYDRSSSQNMDWQHMSLISSSMLQTYFSRPHSTRPMPSF